MTDRDLMQQALEALELLAKLEHPASNIRTKTSGRIYPHRVATDAAAMLRERLATTSPSAPHSADSADTFCNEPVGEIVPAFAGLTAVSIPVMPPVGTKLYTSPQRREYDEQVYYPARKALIADCEAEGHNWQFKHTGPLGDPWFSCTKCATAECRREDA